jgi:hypothetical protein
LSSIFPRFDLAMYARPLPLHLEAASLTDATLVQDQLCTTDHVLLKAG